MTEQFSQEYIDFMQSDEAKALQKHELGCWDFFMWEGVIYVVTGVGCDGIYAAKANGRAKASWLNTQEDLAGRELWLPTLWQLLGVIEGARYAWWKSPGGTWHIWKPGMAESEEVKNEPDMLTAAQLAVKVVESV